jgi:hypothetical protein
VANRIKNIHFVVYLSGETKSVAWHRVHDTVAASVTMPAECLDALLERGDIEVGEDTIDVDILADAASDLDWPTVAQLCTCEACCGTVHIVTGRI